LYKYKLGREVLALNDPVAYLTAKKNAVDALINPAKITTNINNETFAIGGTLGYPGAAAAPADANAYAPLAAPFVRDLAANKVLEKIKMRSANLKVITGFHFSLDPLLLFLLGNFVNRV